MKYLLKYMGISLVIVSCLAIGACVEDGMVLLVTIDTPQDGATVTASPITVSGTVTKTAEVKINDAVVPLKNGKFSNTVNLTEGKNVINVDATKGKEVTRQTVTVVYSPSK